MQPDKTAASSTMQDESVALSTIIDWVLYGLIPLVLLMLRWVFFLDKKLAAVESEQEHQRELAKKDAELRDAQRREIVAAIEKQEGMLHDHNNDVLTKIGELGQSVAKLSG